MISVLSRWVRRRKRLDVSHLEVIVYTRAQCGCCHKALDLLQVYRRRYKFSLCTVDIDSDPELTERYNTSVPVVAVDGKVRFRGVVNSVLFDRLLEAEDRKRGR